ncbi:MAG: hypothetical protein V4729_02285 [Pseudomonadota bacterium]
MRLFLVCALVALVAGCASSRPHQIHAAELNNFGSTPLSHTVYLGSDQEFHYFAWSSGKSGGKWKVSRSELAFSPEWPVAQGRTAFLKQNQQGQWQPYEAGGAP